MPDTQHGGDSQRTTRELGPKAQRLSWGDGADAGDPRVGCSRLWHCGAHRPPYEQGHFKVSLGLRSCTVSAQLKRPG